MAIIRDGPEDGIVSVLTVAESVFRTRNGAGGGIGTPAGTGEVALAIVGVIKNKTISVYRHQYIE